MKLSISKVLKPVMAVILISTFLSSCVVRTRTARRPPPRRTETIIVKP